MIHFRLLHTLDFIKKLLIIQILNAIIFLIRGTSVKSKTTLYFSCLLTFQNDCFVLLRNVDKELSQGKSTGIQFSQYQTKHRILVLQHFIYTTYKLCLFTQRINFESLCILLPTTMPEDLFYVEIRMTVCGITIWNENSKQEFRILLQHYKSYKRIHKYCDYPLFEKFACILREFATFNILICY